ncbi:LamG domain-containing protein [Kitasatospora phosalacinea]|uniref:LamG domain-containing protein n=1 Tax=Kitasatospora phosalacinea TaxID=2065 RepID=UPI0036641425
MPNQGPPNFPQPFSSQQPGFGGPQPFVPAAQPNWEAMAEQQADRNRRRKWMWTGGIVLGACVLGGIVGTALLSGLPDGKGGDGPSASASGSASGAASASASGSQNVPVNAPTLPGQPNTVVDHAGSANLTVSSDALVDTLQSGGYALRTRANPNSFAQTEGPVVDVSKSFTFSAWVYNEAPDGYRTIVSQGDGVSYSFDISRDDFGGKTVWIFRVQSAGEGNEATSYHALSPTMQTVGKWVLVTGVFDASQRTISLYLDGAPVASTKVPGIFNAPGPLQFGRVRNHSAWGGFWAGAIGHMQLWDKALTDAQIQQLKKSGGVSDAVPKGSWLIG